MSRESTNWVRGAVSGVFAGLTVAFADLLIGDRVESSVETIALGGRLQALLILPGIGAVAGMALGATRRIGFDLSLVVLAALLGRVIASGPQAQTMLLANWWWLFMGAATGVGLVVVRRLVPNRLVMFLLALAVLMILTSWVGLNHRGRYEAARALILAMAGIAYGGACSRWRIPLPGRVLATLAVAGTVVGVVSVARSQRIYDWCEQRGTHVTFYAKLARRHLASAGPKASKIDRLVLPFFGSRAHLESNDAMKAAGGPPRGVLFLTVDALRADMRDRDVAGRPACPNIDRMAREGFEFTRSYCSHPSSHLSLLGMFSGRYPSQLMNQKGGLDEVPLIMDALRERGVETRACFPSAIHTKLTPKNHFTRLDFGFGAGNARITAWKDLAPDDLYEAIRPRDMEGPWFSWVHYIRPHIPYNSAAEEHVSGDSDFERYAAEVRHTDAEIQALLDRFAADGLLEDTWVIISADHGEEFREHGYTSHGGHLYEEQIHVPMIIHGKGIPTGRHDRPVSLVDIAPTLHQVFGLPAVPSGHYATRSLVPPMYGIDDPGRLDHVLAECPPVSIGLASVLAAAIGPRFKLISDERLQRVFLYDLENDPGEKRNGAEEDPTRVSDLLGWIAKLRGMVDDLAKGAHFAVDWKLGLISHAEFIEPVLATQAAVREGLANIQDDFVVFVLSYLADGGEARHFRAMIDRWKDRQSEDCRAATATARFALRINEPGDRAVCLERAPLTTDPFLLVALYKAFTVRHDPGLLDVAPKKTTTADIAVQLARTRYLRIMGRPEDDEALVRRGFGDPNAWVSRLAIECMIERPIPALYDDLLDRYASDGHRRMKAALLEVMGRVDDPRFRQIALEMGRTAPLWERRRVMTGLFGASMLRGAMARWRPADGGATGVDDEGRVALAGARIPLTTFEKGTVVALMLSFDRYDAAKPSVTLKVGGASRTIEHPPPERDVPVLLALPPGLRPSALELVPSSVGVRLVGVVSIDGAGRAIDPKDDS